MNDFQVKTVLARATKYGRKPKTAQQALRQALALLEEEGTWCQSTLFQDGDPREAFENGSICGSWQVCAMGALGIVTGEMPVKVVKEEILYGYSDETDTDYQWEDLDGVYNARTAPITASAAAYVALAIARERHQQEQDDERQYWEEDRIRAIENYQDDIGPFVPEPLPTLAAVSDHDAYRDVYEFNDQATREDVIRVFKEALALSRKKNV